MTRADLLRGYRWMIRALYRYDRYGQRLVRSLEAFGPPPEALRRSAKPVISSGLAGTALRIAAYFLFTRDHARRNFFLRTLWQVMRRRPSMQKLLVAISFMTIHKHFHEYVERTHGDPESAGDRSPFSSEDSLARRVEPMRTRATAGSVVETEPLRTR
jgi:hypothetical protein